MNLAYDYLDEHLLPDEEALDFLPADDDLGDAGSRVPADNDDEWLGSAEARDNWRASPYRRLDQIMGR